MTNEPEQDKTNFLFIFTFDDGDEWNEDSLQTEVYLFKILTNDPQQLLNYVDGDEEKFYDMISNNEDLFGVHDVGFCPDLYFMGYNSYEIKAGDRLTVMNNIREFFISEGFETSEIIIEGLFDEYGYEEEEAIAHKHLSEKDIEVLNTFRDY